jgi:predicted lipid-binding transport protein (Tim44 family)
MNFPQRTRALVKTLAVALALAMPAAMISSAIMSSPADARAGRGFSSGSRGMRSFTPPPSTRTAPNAAQPMQRSITQPGMNNATRPGAATNGGFFSRPGLLGGLAAGFLGAGLFGMLFGGGLFGGLGGLSSIIGLILQIGLIYLLVRFAMSWWQRRNASGPAYANVAQGAAPSQDNGAQNYARSGFGSGTGSNAPPLEINEQDYQAFERLLGEVQTAWSGEDVNKLHTIATPEMVSYFTQDLKENADRGVVNTVSGVKLLQGDLAEAWREGQTDYATVAMRFALVDKTVERATGRVVEGSDAPIEATEVWTFARRPGGTWELSAIQQV